MTTEPITVHTDGACRGNPGPGGWAWVAQGGRWCSGAEAMTTNQRMELAAVADVLRALGGPLLVVSDSAYVVNGINQRWYEAWQQRGWRKADRKPVANRDLWEAILDGYLYRQDEVTFRHVPGHSGDEMNELADRLAVQAALSGVGDAGFGDGGVADDPH